MKGFALGGIRQLFESSQGKAPALYRLRAELQESSGIRKQQRMTYASEAPRPNDDTQPMNEAFLAQVARHYYEQYGSSISQLPHLPPSVR